MSNPQDPNFEQQPVADVPPAPAAPEAPAPHDAPAAAPQYAPPAAPAASAPQYAAPQQYAAAPPEKSTNTMSIISLISSIVGLFTFGVLCILGVVLGHMSLKQIKQRGENGRGLSIAGLVIGYLGIAGWIIGGIIALIAVAMFAAAFNDPSFVAELENLS